MRVGFYCLLGVLWFAAVAFCVWIGLSAAYDAVVFGGLS